MIKTSIYLSGNANPCEERIHANSESIRTQTECEYSEPECEPITATNEDMHLANINTTN
jgi:hypothetical protein